MADSTRMSAAARRRHLLEVALTLFARQSFEATTTREIARAAGVSDALLYRYFPSKQALHDELADICTRDGSYGAELLLSSPPSTALLIQAVHFLLYNILIGSTAGQPFKASLDRMLGQSLAGNGELLARFNQVIIAPWLTALEQLLPVAQQAGDLRPGTEPKLAVWFTYQLGLAVRLFENCPTPPIPDAARGLELLDALVRFALYGLGLTDAALARSYHPESLLAETRRLLSAASPNPHRSEETAHGPSRT